MSFAEAHLVLQEFAVPIPWRELIRRTIREFNADDCIGPRRAARLLLLPRAVPGDPVPAGAGQLLPAANLTDDVGRALGPFVSPQVLELIRDQMRRLADNGERRPAHSWRAGGPLEQFRRAGLHRRRAQPRLRHRGRTAVVEGAADRHRADHRGRAFIVLVALTLVLVGPERWPSYLGKTLRAGAAVRVDLARPAVAARLRPRVTTAIGLTYYFGPDAEQDWVWMTPGAVLATVAVAGRLAGVQVLRRQLHRLQRVVRRGRRSDRADAVVLRVRPRDAAGAELNAEIEHASPYGKAPGQKSATGRRLLGRRAARAFEKSRRLAAPDRAPVAADRPRIGPVPKPVPALGLIFASAALLARAWKHRRDQRPGAPADEPLSSGGRSAM